MTSVTAILPVTTLFYCDSTTWEQWIWSVVSSFRQHPQVPIVGGYIDGATMITYREQSKTLADWAREQP